MLSFSDVACRRDGNVLFEQASFVVQRGHKLGLTGAKPHKPVMAKGTRPCWDGSRRLTGGQQRLGQAPYSKAWDFQRRFIPQQSAIFLEDGGCA